MSMDVESVNVDATQLSKLKLCLSASNGNVSHKTYGTVTPPPSPLDIHGDVDSRPPHSYVRIVIMALLDCPGHEATIREIYDMITQKFPYYQENRLHWKNSVRHNLTVFSCFQRVAMEEGPTSRGSNRWRLVGDWRSILAKAEAVPVRKYRPSCSPSVVDKFAKKKKKHQKSSRDDKLEVRSRRDKELAKRKKREKARKLRLAAGIRRIDRMPLANVNYHDFTPAENPAENPTEEPLPSRMSTPPPRLPGIENIFLPPPTPSISPLREPLNIWDDSPDDLNLLSIPNLSLIDEITDIISTNDTTETPHLTASKDAWDVISQFESDIDADIERQAAWHQFTPEQSPTKAWTELSKAGLCGYGTSSKSKNLWNLVDSAANPEVMDLFTFSKPSEWPTSVTTESDYLVVS